MKICVGCLKTHPTCPMPLVLSVETITNSTSPPLHTRKPTQTQHLRLPTLESPHRVYTYTTTNLETSANSQPPPHTPAKLPPHQHLRLSTPANPHQLDIFTPSTWKPSSTRNLRPSIPIKY